VNQSAQSGPPLSRALPECSGSTLEQRAFSRELQSTTIFSRVLPEQRALLWSTPEQEVLLQSAPRVLQRSKLFSRVLWSWALCSGSTLGALSRGGVLLWDIWCSGCSGALWSAPEQDLTLLMSFPVYADILPAVGTSPPLIAIVSPRQMLQ
jgi:hypothetical protein